MSQQIKEVMEAISNNIKGLEENEEISLTDVRTLLIDIYGCLKNMWENLDEVFIYTKEIKEIEKATLKGEKYDEKISDDAKRLYQ